MSYQAYQQVQQRVENPRETEYRLFATVTKSLMDVRNLPITDQRVIKAIDWNRRMWSTFSADCGATGNQLPKELRASIISLGLWVSKHSSKVMRKEATIEPLITINQTVMAGLQPSQAAAPRPAAAPPENRDTDTQGQTTGRPVFSQLSV